MDYPIREIELSDQFERYTMVPAQAGQAKRLSNLSKINIFVGENNSGKSKFLRQLAAIEKLRLIPNCELGKGQKGENLAEIVKAFRENVGHTFVKSGIQNDAAGILSETKSIPDIGVLEEGVAPLEKGKRVAARLSEISDLGSVTHSGNYDRMAIIRQLKGFAETFFENLSHVPGNERLGSYVFTKVYIPTLRGLRNLTPDNKDIYAEKTLNDYFRQVANFRPQIFTGLGLYQEIQKLLLGNLAQRKKIRDFETFLSEHFFDPKPVALIPKLDPPMLDIKIGDESERPVHLLGDGLQSIIILTFPLFMNQEKPLLVFCEEPELYMHPGLQRVLLSAFGQFRSNQYFLTTHSNHFLDLTLDFKSVSVYTFRKELEGSEEEKTAQFRVENISNEDSRSLQLLGVRNSSVFLSNCTIWVEGITDRRYLGKFLELYQRTPGVTRVFEEDLHYSFVEYGGANITHFSFLDSTADPIVVDRLCARLFLIADQDNAAGAKAARHKELETKLGQRYCCLKCKEIENLLPPDVIKKVVNDYEGSNVEFNVFSQEDYKQCSLGEFIEKNALKGPRNRKASYAKDNSLRDKVDFCSRAVREMKSFVELSPEARALTKRFYDFILENNK